MPARAVVERLDGLERGGLQVGPGAVIDERFAYALSCLAARPNGCIAQMTRKPTGARLKSDATPLLPVRRCAAGST